MNNPKSKALKRRWTPLHKTTVAPDNATRARTSGAARHQSAISLLQSQAKAF